MKKITLFMFLMIASFGYSQDLLLGFQPGESGGVNGAPFGGMPAPIVETGLGTNTTQVLKIVGNTTGEPWQGINLNLTSPVQLTTTQTMTMDVYSTTPVVFLVKVNGGVSGAPAAAAAVSYPGGSTWQTISFTFNSVLDGQAAAANGTYASFVIHAYWEAGRTAFFSPTTCPTPARTFYVDNIRGPLGTIAPPPVLATPTVVAPVPPVATRPQGTVRSIFSESYTPVATMSYVAGANTYNTDWCAGTTTLYNASPFASNTANRVVGLGSGTVAGTSTTTPAYIGSDLVGGCEGIDFQGGRFDLTNFTHLHIDIWTPIRTMANRVLTIKLSNWNAANTGEANGNIITINNTSATAYRLPSDDPSPLLATGGQFLSFDIPLSAFVNGGTAPGGIALARNNINQMVLEGNLGTVYYDNLYFYGGPLSTSDFEVAKAKLYPNPATNALNVESTMSIEKVSVYNLLGQEVISRTPNTELVTLDVASLQSGVYIVRTSINGNVSSSRFIKE